MGFNLQSSQPFVDHTSSPRFAERSDCGPRVVSVSSGKGGVGKTMTTINFGLSLRHLGYRVLILDGDFGLANLDIVLGLQARYNISSVLNGAASIKDVVIDGPHGLKIIPSGSGINGLSQLSADQRACLSMELRSYAQDFDYLLIDTGAGISENVLHLNSLADRMVVVTSSEPHAMTDAYALIKVMNESYPSSQASLLVNMCPSQEEGLKIYRRMSDVAAKYLQVTFSYLGHVPRDPQFQKLLLGRRGATADAIHTVAGQAWQRCTMALAEALQDRVDLGDAGRFWNSFVRREPMLEAVLP